MLKNIPPKLGVHVSDEARKKLMLRFEGPIELPLLFFGSLMNRVNEHG